VVVCCARDAVKSEKAARKTVLSNLALIFGKLSLSHSTLQSGPLLWALPAAEDHLLSKARLDLVGHRVSAGAAKCPRIPAPVDATLPVKAAV
jgi:hypothetical protein